MDDARAAMAAMIGDTSPYEMAMLMTRLEQVVIGVPCGAAMLVLAGLAGKLAGQHLGSPTEPDITALNIAMQSAWAQMAAHRGRHQVVGHA